jgi:hypothetical protein
MPDIDQIYFKFKAVVVLAFVKIGVEVEFCWLDELFCKAATGLSLVDPLFSGLEAASRLRDGLVVKRNKKNIRTNTHLLLKPYSPNSISRGVSSIA